MIKEVSNLSSFVHINGYRVLENKGLVIVWMSVGNSYFKREVIEEILEFVTTNFSKVKLMMPNEPAVYNYLGLGYEEVKAKRKARLNSNRLKNIANEIIYRKNFTEKCEIQIVDWKEDIIENKLFKEKLVEINKLFNKSPEFNGDVKNSTRIVLSEKMKEGTPLEEGINLGVNYLLEELAFICSSSKIFNVEETVYLYHKEWPVYENLVNGLYDGKKKNDSGFLLAKK